MGENLGGGGYVFSFEYEPLRFFPDRQSYARKGKTN